MAVEKVDGVENIDAPQGATSIEIEEAELAPNVTEMDDGSVVIGELEEQIAPIQVPFNANLAEFIDDTELGRISSDLVGEVQEDINSRKEWEDQYKSGLELLGMNYEDRAEPFEGASGIVHPLLAESVTQFQAQAYRELLPAGGPVKTAIIGQETSEVLAQA